ncbi:MAG: branched-chain amino acid permease [Herpetosiphonaceae bacterium]|nr:MAG: branched-chain amino acid permease [Herpetosiphonaceae bacterium]
MDAKPKTQELERTRGVNLRALLERQARGELWRGFVDTMPLWIGVVPFGIAYTLAAQTAGLTPLQTLAMSLLVFAGASQFTAAGLFAGGAAGLSIILTTLVINLRHLLLSASLAPFLRHLSLWKRAGLAFGITDESYAVAVRRIMERQAGPALLLGANISLYVSWQLSTLAGLLLGGIISDPTALGLGLVFPLSFTVLLMPYLRSRPAWAAALVAGGLALAGRMLLPGSWYLLFAALGGSLAGALVEKKR